MSYESYIVTICTQVVIESCEGLSLRGLHSGKQVPPRPYVHYHLLGYQVHARRDIATVVTTVADTLVLDSICPTSTKFCLTC
jgi:hypothetical protein